MSTKVSHAPPAEQAKALNAVVGHNGTATSTDYHRPPADRADLPVFPLEVGYRTMQDPATGEWRDLPLTLLDLLFPTDDDVGVVKLSQSPWHDKLTVLLATMLRMYLTAQGWLATQDVLIHWGRRGVPPKSPDVAAFLGGHLPERKEKSYRVGRDGPLPAFVLEITSEETRQEDLDGKKLFYAAVGVKEYLIIDLLAKATTDWQLLGYRLGESPFYEGITPDAEGGLTFATIGLRFVAVGNERIDVYDVKTGERLLTPDEQKAKAEEEQARADEEKARADRYEALLKQAGLL
ncbi:MAG: Uma2 family endonuclease [Caldilineaceae bacterium]